MSATLAIRQAWPRLRLPSAAATAGLLLTLIVVAGAVGAPLLTHADPLGLGEDILAAPSRVHPMGTDDLGRDLFARVLYGGRVSLGVGLFSGLLSVTLGVGVGMVAGFTGGVADEVLMRVTEIFQVMPKLLAAVVVVSLIGSSLTNEVLVIGLLSWPATARVIRSRVQVLRSQDFIAAARIGGASNSRILCRNLLPNVFAFVLVSTSLQIASAIVSESFLSFLGLGDPGHPSWGLLLQQGQLYLQQAWWLTTLPGIALAMTVLGMNLLGDGPVRRDQGTPLMRDATAAQPVLSVRDLTVSFAHPSGRRITVVRGVGFEVMPGEIVGLVGESGSGKSITARAILRLLPANAAVGGRIEVAGEDVGMMSEKRLRALRGSSISMIFQDPMTSFDPVHRVGEQIGEAITVHHPQRRGLTKRVGALLAQVGIAPSRARAYPHELSGGMRQRAMMAMAVANTPALIIADEPTTALDVTVQDQVMQLMRDLNQSSGTAILLITHNIAVVASLCRRVVVLYAGRVMEDGPAEALLAKPRHPYTWSLLRSVPRLDQPAGRLMAIAGQPPDPAAPPAGCMFQPRCPRAVARCVEEEPPLGSVGAGHQARCWRPMDEAA